MIISEIILSITMSIFLLTGTAIGVYLVVTEVKENKEIKIANEYRDAFYKATSKQLLIEIVFDPGEYQVLEGRSGQKYCIYLPDTNYQVGDLISVKFSPGHIFYKTSK